MINGHDMTNVKSALRRLYFIECMLAGNDEEAASAYSAKMMKALDKDDESIRWQNRIDRYA